MKKINFENLPSTNTPISAGNLNQMQDNIEESAVIVSATKPTTSEKVWIQKGKNLAKKWYKSEWYNDEKQQIEPHVEFCRTDFIEIAPNKDYVQSNSRNLPYGMVFVFDKNRNLLEVLNRDNLLSPFKTTNANAKYVMIDLYYGNVPELSWMQLEQGTVATEYEEYIEPKIYVKNNNGAYEEFSKNEDTGWIDLSQFVNKTIASVRGESPPMARKINNTVYFKGEVYISTEPLTNVFNILENLPIYLLPRYQATGGGITFEDSRPYSIWTESGHIVVCIENKSVQQEYKGFNLCNLAPHIVD